MAVEQDFQQAQERAKSLKSKPSNETLLELYSLYKQAVAGDASGKRPGMFDMVGRAKYDAWAGRKGMAKEAAMSAYIALVDKLAGA